VQTFARLAAAYGEEDTTMSLEELQEFAKSVEPQLCESSNRLRTLEVDLQVLCLSVMRALPSQPEKLSSEDRKDHILVINFPFAGRL
jgi:hypothetical protein